MKHRRYCPPRRPERRFDKLSAGESPTVQVQPDLSRYAVLVPTTRYIEPECDAHLRELERLGIAVERARGCSAIDHARCAMASEAMVAGKEAVLFVDADTEFLPEDAVRLLRRPEPVVAGIYFQKRIGAVNADFPPDVAEIGFGTEGGDYPLLHVGAGFLRVRHDVFRQLIERLDLPCCTATGKPLWPFFLPLVDRDEHTGEMTYYGEDYAFCRRCRQAGIPLLADTRARIVHIGPWGYSWEEGAGMNRERLNGIKLKHFRKTAEQVAAELKATA